ncbi:MAG: hypothetical protein U5J96_19900 [Ignavibacteriaceae bacterium]|nr:hypothetical protein [Ignavibacteriaceae bacterium]
MILSYVCFYQNNGWTIGNNGTIIYTPNGSIPVELSSFTTTANYTNNLMVERIGTNNSGLRSVSIYRIFNGLK